MFKRITKLPSSNSFFLFGARGTGKSTLLHAHFPEDSTAWFDLLDLDVEARLASRPQSFSEELRTLEKQKKLRWVVIDEIQKIPPLLDVVHSEIERKRFRFALTGSSSRKLKRGKANLLAGRAFTRILHPLTHRELGSVFDLHSVLKWGSLPRIFSLSECDRFDFLKAYAQTYLKEEIQAEQLIRKIPPFRNFLEVCAQTAGQIVNHSKIARDIASDPVSVHGYFEILEETYFGFLLKPYHRSIRKRQRTNPKFYFFDSGIQRALARTLKIPLDPRTTEFGLLFEQFLICEINRLQDYAQMDWELSYLRTKDDAEIDLIIDRPGSKSALVEIKSSSKITPEALKHLLSLKKEFTHPECFCLSLDPVERVIDGISCLPWNKGIQELGL